MGKRRRWGIVTIIIIFIAMALAVTQLHSLAEETIYIKDIKGDPSVLKDVTITGMVQDKYQGQFFTIEEGKVRQKREAFDHYLNNTWERRNYREPIKIDDKDELHYFEFRVSPGDSDILDVEANLRGTFGSIGYDTGLVGVEGSVRKTRQGKSVSRPSLRKGNEYVIVNEKIFFTVPTISEYRGKNGIFKVENLPDQENNIHEETIKRIVTFNLNELEDQFNVWGITSVDDKLILITSINDDLTISLYEESGLLIESKTIETNIEYFRFFDLNIITKEEDIIMDFESTVRSQSPVIVFDVKNGINIKNITYLDLVYEDYKLLRVDAFYYIGNRLYVFADMGSKMWRSDDYAYYIYVYENNALVYVGELVTEVTKEHVPTRQVVEKDFRNYDYLYIDNIVVTPNSEI
ncbi:hypothetical protein EDC18_10977 [Natranaerovirga pectinivora]|uniref:Uncharacterized protein n=1 Tax=Natranaerovirga pectinivora TaxID=682400 RepID=A0A4R3MIG4_9FIRM|nr:hypothetical protein [Natranaerovirga pectinivora]TCT13114.1 hypothetical protein EDC18_10977 [Natranaerovirga pectinivora]